MEIKIKHKEIKEALNVLNKGVSSKETIPALTGIMIETLDDKLRLYATDLEVGIEGFIDCEVEEKGKTVVPSTMFKKYINKLNVEEVSLVVKGNTINISANGSNFNLQCYNVDNFTEIPNFKDNFFTLPQIKLNEMIDKTTFAGIKSNIEANPVLKAVKFKSEDNYLEASATNRSRLSYINKDISFDDEIDLNIPIKSANILKGMLNEGEVDIYIKENMLKFDLGNYVLYTRLIDGKFPDYQSIIPDNYDYEIKINKNEFKDAIERASILDEDDSIILEFLKNKVIITELESQIGNIEEEVNLEEPVDIEESKIGINAKYLLEGIKKSPRNVITLQFSGELKPLIIKEENINWTYIIMPIRIPKD